MRKPSLNHTFRLVWSVQHQTFIPASEHARGRGKQGRALRAVLIAAAMGVAGAAAAADLPTGGRVVAGQGSIAQSGSTMTITQGSQRMVADWQGFSIGQGHTVQFVQPSSSAAALNRVTGSEPSVIQGALRANGQVFLVNPNGVLFTPSAQVNVGGLVASTLNVSNDDFMAGRYRFAGDSTNAVMNQGNVVAANGGTVAMIAARIVNTGSITVPEGNVLMGAGSRVTLDLGGPVKIEVAQGALDALIEQGGAIRADGGLVYLTAHAANALTTTVINHTGVTEAKTLASGKEGRIFLMGDMENDRIAVGGRLDASAPAGGNGGFVETSAAQVQVNADARVTTLAANGHHGTWLIDPQDFTIGAGSGAQSDTGIGADTLGANLAGGNIALATVSSGSGNGDIHVNAPVRWSADTTLTLSAHRNININADITATGANGKLALEYGQGSVAASNTSDYHLAPSVKIHLRAGENFSEKLGSDGATRTYYVITALGDEGSVTGIDLQGMNLGPWRDYALGADIDASATAGWAAGAGFTPVYPIDGIAVAQIAPRFAGLGHAIDQLTIARPSTSEVGLFGRVNAGELCDVHLTRASVTGGNSVGALLGRGNGDTIVRGSSATGGVSGNQYVGGLVGRMAGGNSRISASSANVTVTASDASAGGLVGYTHGFVDASSASGAVSGTTKVGGLVGWADDAAVTRSHATGNVIGTEEYVGGLIGQYSGISVQFVYATGNVTGEKNVGGLIGYKDEGNTTLDHAFATGNVMATFADAGDSGAGGLIGYNVGHITNAYATGAVTAPTTGGVAVGGLVGYHSEGDINTTYATGPLSGAIVGGLIGTRDSGTVSNSFWDTTRSGIGTSAGGAGRTTTQLLARSTFADAGWDITAVGRNAAIWRIYEGLTTPWLRYFFSRNVDVTPAATTREYDGTTVTSGSFTLQESAPIQLTSAGAAPASVPRDGVHGTAVYTLASPEVGTHALTVSGLYSNQLEYNLSFNPGVGTIIARTAVPPAPTPEPAPVVPPGVPDATPPANATDPRLETAIGFTTPANRDAQGPTPPSDAPVVGNDGGTQVREMAINSLELVHLSVPVPTGEATSMPGTNDPAHRGAAQIVMGNPVGIVRVFSINGGLRVE